MAEDNHTQMLLQQQQSNTQQQQMQQPQIQQQQMQETQQTQQQAVAVSMSLGSNVEQTNNQMNVKTSVPINVATINVSQPQQMQTIQQTVNTSSLAPVHMAVNQLTAQAQTVQAGNMISQSSGPHPTMIHPTMTMAQSPLQHVQVIQQPLSIPYLQHVYTPQQQMVFPGNLTLQNVAIGATQGLSLQLQAKPAIDPKNQAGGQTLQAVNQANKNIVNAGTMMTPSGQVIGTTTQKANFPQQMMAAPGKSTTQIITTQTPLTMFSQAQIFADSFTPLPQGISWATPGNFQSSTLLTQNPIILSSPQSHMFIQSQPQIAMHLPVAAATAPVPATTFAATPMAPQKHKQPAKCQLDPEPCVCGRANKQTVMKHRIMDHRRLLVNGTSTHTNVLKGKQVRQQDDGADNFADYSTDSNEEVTSSIDHDYYPKLPKVSEIRLKPSTQNVRTIQSSNILHSEAKDNDKPTKILTSTKPFKNKVSDYQENIDSSQTKKQDMSSKLQEDEHQNSTIRVNVLHSETEDKNKQNNTKIMTSSLKSSKNYNTNSLRDSVTKKASPLLPKISLPSESGCHNISTSRLSPILKQSKERKKIFVNNENASQDLVDTSHIHTLSPVVKLKEINTTNVTQSESLADESPNEKNNNRKDSTIFKSPKPSEKNKAVLNNSAIMNSESNAEYDETTAVVQKKKEGIIKNHGESECVSSNKILSRSQQKNNVSRSNKELFEKRSISQNFYNEKEKTHKKAKASEAYSDKYTENSNVPAKEINSMQRTIPVNKIYDKLKTSRNLSKDNEINKTSTSNFHSEKKNIKVKNKEKQKASETIEENQNSDNFLEDETETTFIHKKRKEQASESHEDISLQENNNQQVCSPKKKINEKHSTDVNVPLRRSVRQKFPPLERWRNERILYKFINGIPAVCGIDPGVKNTFNEEKIKKKVKKRPVLDAVNGQTIRDPLMDRFDAVPWDEESEENPYHIKRIFRKTWKSS